MTTVDELWYLADEAAQQAEQTYHDLCERHDGFGEFTRTRSVSRPRFRTVAERTVDNGLPYGAHTLPYSQAGELLLVRHEDVDMWVLPGGEVDGEESFRAAARRELAEEAGVTGEFVGLGLLGRVEFHCDDHFTWGVLPIYAVRTTRTDPEVRDPDGEISAASWFAELPADTRDRDVLTDWRDRRFQ
ncbi:MAG: NUDIX hydrolase [Haloarculaceae archaeon]